MKALARPLHTSHVLKKHYTTGQQGRAGEWGSRSHYWRNFMSLGISVQQHSLVPWVLLSSELPAP